MIPNQIVDASDSVPSQSSTTSRALHASLFMVCGILFLALTLWAASGRYLPGEQYLLHVIVEHRIPLLNQPALLVSTLGSINIILPLWAATLIILAMRRMSNDVLWIFFVPLGYPLYVLIKSGVGRPGPLPSQYPWLYDLPLGYYVEGLLRRQLQALPPQGLSLPVTSQPVTAQGVTQVMESGYVSGHALVAVLFYGSLALILWRQAERGSLRWLVARLLAILAVLVGIVRIYMGIHFPSDVLGAWLLAILCFILIDDWVRIITPRVLLVRQHLNKRQAIP